MKTCMIVDDSELIREIASRIVKELGFEPLGATTAGEAIEKCGDGGVAAVLLDWDLPAMGALDFLRGAGNLDQEKRPVIILCAAENDPQQFTLAKAAGVSAHILKPFDKSSVETAFAELKLIDAPAACPIEAAAGKAS